jgi:hypothetical protein
MQRVSALRYKWVDSNNTNSSSSVAIVHNDNDTGSNNNIRFYPTLDVGSATQQLYT